MHLARQIIDSAHNLQHQLSLEHYKSRKANWWTAFQWCTKYTHCGGRSWKEFAPSSSKKKNKNMRLFKSHWNKVIKITRFGQSSREHFTFQPTCNPPQRTNQDSIVRVRADVLSLTQDFCTFSHYSLNQLLLLLKYNFNDHEKYGWKLEAES